MRILSHAMSRLADRRTRRAGALALTVVLTGVLFAVMDAGAISGGSISPTTLVASQQEFQVTYSGKDTSPSNPNLIVEECIANDTKVGFNPTIDCSPPSRINYFGVPADGTVVYGGRPSNPTAPFVGIDPNTEEWSVCTPNSGVTNYQSGYFRVADFPADQGDDFFIPFTCGTPPSTTTTVPPTTTTTTAPPQPRPRCRPPPRRCRPPPRRCRPPPRRCRPPPRRCRPPPRRCRPPPRRCRPPPRRPCRPPGVADKPLEFRRPCPGVPGHGGQHSPPRRG